MPEMQNNSTTNSSSGFPEPISFSELRAMEMAEPPWAVESLFESGTINMISAAPNQFKSWIALHTAICLASGTPVFGKFAVDRQPVFVWNEEDSLGAFKKRNAMLDPLLPDLGVFFYANQGLRLDKTTVNGLLAAMGAKGARFLIVDSLISVHSADENSAKEVQGVFERLKDISRKGITVLTCHHHKKGANRNEADALGEDIRGSTTMMGALNSLFVCLPAIRESDGSSIIRISNPKQKNAEKLLPFRIRFSAKEGTATLVYDGESPADANATKAVEDVLAFLNDARRWVPTKEVVAAKVAGEKATGEALRELERGGLALAKERSELRTMGVELTTQGQHNEKCYRVAEVGGGAVTAT